MEYDYGIDMWSTGCTLFELFTGKILFPGESNNQMLKVMMEMRGRMYPKYYKRGQLWHLHFDDKDNFVSIERDKTTNKVRCHLSPAPAFVLARLSRCFGGSRMRAPFQAPASSPCMLAFTPGLLLGQLPTAWA